MDNLSGQILLKRYRVDAFIGSGGMSIVYRVWDMQRNVPLAMKILRGDLAEDPSTLKLFEREARALKKLTHPNIVRFYGFYQDSNLYFLLEEFIEGTSLEEILEHKGSLPVGEVLIYLKGLCAALGYAHSKGVVHCDIKPGNVLVDHSGHFYLTDFGVARHADSTTTTLPGAGTPAYMAPEQIKGEAVHATTDTYTLGVLMYEMLTGKRPFRGVDPGSKTSGSTLGERVRYEHLHATPGNPKQLNPVLSDTISQAVLKAIQKIPQERFQSTQVMLSEFCEAAGVDATTIPTRLEQSFPPSKDQIGKSKHTKSTKRLIPTRIIFFIGVPGIIMLVLLLIVFLNGLNPGDSEIISTPYEQKVNNTSKSPFELSDVTQTEILSQFLTSTATFLPPTTNIPTLETIFPSRTQPPPTYTPRPSNTPRSDQPIMTALVNMHCREEPNTGSRDSITVFEGEKFKVLARWSNDWLLLDINKPEYMGITSSKCCWVGGRHDLNVTLESIRLIYQAPDRKTCILP